MKNVLLLSNASENSPSIRYRLLFPLTILVTRKQLSYRFLSFFSLKTERVLNSDKQFLKILFSLKDAVCFFVRFLYTVLTQRADVVFIKNYIFPFGGAWIEKIAYCLIGRNKMLYYDIDDAIYLNQTRSQNKLFSKLRDASAKVEFWARNADKILVPNQIIKQDLVSKYSLNKVFVEFLACPYEKQYFLNKEELISCKENGKLIFIWLGSPHTQDNLTIFDDFFKRLPQFVQNAEIVIMGANASFQPYRKLAHVRFVAWTPENERDYMRKAHFGLNPLTDDVFESRKSAFKVIQYYRAGILPIVSDVGINKKLIQKYGGIWVENVQSMDDIFNYVVEMRGKHLCEAQMIFDQTQELSVEHNAKIFVEMFKHE